MTTLAVGVCLAVEGLEPARSLKASDLLPASLLKGPTHEVAHDVGGKAARPPCQPPGLLVEGGWTQPLFVRECPRRLVAGA